MTRRFVINLNAPFWRMCRFIKKIIPYVLIGIMIIAFLKFAKYAFITGIDNELARRDAIMLEYRKIDKGE